MATKLQQIDKNGGKAKAVKAVIRRAKQESGKVADLQPMKASSKAVVVGSRVQLGLIDAVLSQNRRY